MSNKSTNIGIGGDLTQLTTSLQQATQMLRDLANDMRKITGETQRSTDDLNESFKGFDKTASLAGMNLMNLSNLISDLPYGFRGIANNLSYIGEMFAMLTQTAGGFTAAMKSLWSSLIGPAGILLAFNTAIAAFDAWIGNGAKAKETTEKLTSAFSDQTAEARGLFGYLEQLVVSGGNLNEIKKTAKEINEKYNTTLNAEKITVEQIASAYSDVLEAIKQKMAIEAGGEAISKGIKAEEASDIKLIKLEAQRTKLVEQRALLNQAIQSQAEKYDVLTAKITALNKQIEEQEAAKQEAINQQNIGLHAQIEARKKLDALGLGEKPKGGKPEISPVYVDAMGLAKDQIDADNKAYFARIENAERQQKEWEDLQKFHTELNDKYWKIGIEETGEFATEEWKKAFKKIGKAQSDGIKQLSEQMNTMVKQYLIETIAQIGELLGAVMVQGKDAFKNGGKGMLEAFAGFLSQFGRLMIAFAVALAGWDVSSKNPAAWPIALAAGIAAVTAAGAIKAYLKKNTAQSVSASSGQASFGGTSYNNNTSGGDVQIYTRLDGRDLVLSGQRTQYIARR